MKTVNDLPVYEGTDKCALDEYSKEMAEKILEVINKNKYNDTDIKNLIAEQDSEIQVLKNALPSETQESENINIKGTIPTKFKEFKLSGNSKQETRSGKNIVNINSNDIVNSNIVANVDNNSLILEGNTSSNFYCAIPINLKTNTNYYISFLATIIDQNNLEFNPYVRVRTDLSGSWVGSSITINRDLTTQQSLEGSFNSGNNTTAYLILYLNAVNDGTQRSAKIKFDNLQLEEGTQATDYEPYGAMPSPEYPSEIQNVEGDVNVTDCNKNIVGGQWTTGLYDVNGNLGNTNGLYKCFRRFLKAGTYSYSYNANIVIARYVNLTKKENLTLSASSFTLDKDSEISLGFRKADSSTWDLGENLADIEFQLQEGSTATDYVEHQEQIVNFPLAQGQKLMLGDYLAADGIHHKRKQIELDGTDFSLYSNQVAGRTIYMISAFSNNNNFKTYDSSILCNILKQGTSSNGNNYLNNNGSSGSLYVSIENSILGITDKSTNEEKLQAFQNLIAETGFVYEGELAEEETEAYTEEQQEAYNQLMNLKAYEEETNVYSTNSTSPIFKVTAVKDINSVITELNTVLLERS